MVGLEKEKEKIEFKITIKFRDQTSMTEAQKYMGKVFIDTEFIEVREK